MDLKSIINTIKNLFSKRRIMDYSFKIGTDFKFTIHRNPFFNNLIAIEYIDNKIWFKNDQDIELNQFIIDNNITSEFNASLEQIILRFS